MNHLVHSKEKFYFTVCLIISLIVYLVLIFTIIGIFFIIMLVISSFFVSGIMLGIIKNNAVQLNERQFPNIYSRVVEYSRRMQLSRVPDVYIMESGGALNAFASRFFGRNFVVLYSDIADLEYKNGSAELDFVIAHELAHIKRRHIIKQIWILPVMWMPLLANAYYRACEFTCDRIAAVYTGNPQAAIRGLSILAVGKVLYPHVNIPEYVINYKQNKGFFTSIAGLMSTHPPLPERVHEIEKMMMNPHHYGLPPQGQPQGQAQPVNFSGPIYG